jgi:transcriptional regulator GlxA family with amidase domain
MRLFDHPAPTAPHNEPVTARTVAILAFPDMEVLDFAGPYEVFNVAGELGDGHPFEVFSVGVDAGPVRGRGGFTVLPTYSLDDAPIPDLVVVPGGAGSRALTTDEPVLRWVRERAGEAELVLSVCTGALVLAAAGLLAGRSATTHHGSYAELAAISPTTKVVHGQRFVRSSETILTSAGVSAGIDLALHAVQLLAGRPTRDLTVAEMEWMWQS